MHAPTLHVPAGTSRIVYICTHARVVIGCTRLLRRAPPSLWAPWQPQIFSAGAYIIHRQAMQQLLDAYLPGLAARMSCRVACVVPSGYGEVVVILRLMCNSTNAQVPPHLDALTRST